MSVRLIFAQNWPNNFSNPLDLVNFALSQQQPGKFPSLAVVDRFGGAEAATLCGALTFARQIAAENAVDVFEFARGVHARKPGVWRNPNDILALYKMAEAIAEAAAVNTKQSVEDLHRT